MSDFTTTATIDRAPAEVFAAILDTRSWWNEAIEGATSHRGDEFGFEVHGLHRTRIRVTDVIPDKRVEWLVLENAFEFIEDQTEWLGNRMVFELKPAGDACTLSFTQFGLVPDYECYEVCSSAWTFFIRDSLRNLIEKGKGNPESATADKPDVPRDEFFKPDSLA
ncbi:SRPBCC domain-containing protein [Kribbella sp. NPDC050281]|uniref:SRPBCC family protein n=1 Tax=Kribbella sp. NPDC050281 TaxID=3155515 RepID=UPI0033ED9148